MVVSEGVVIRPFRQPLYLSEDGQPFLFINEEDWTDTYSTFVPPNGLYRAGLLASELRAAKLPKNITLRLRQASGEPSDFWKESALMPSRVVAGFSSAQSDAYGWNAIVRHGLPPTLHVANETLTIQWDASAFAMYAPRAPETVLLSLPGEVVRSGVPLTVGTLVITVDSGTVSMAGGLLTSAFEADLRSPQAHTLELTLTDDTWLPSIGLDGPASAALLSGLRSAQADARGFNAIVQPSLTAGDLVRLDARTLRLTIPQRAEYDIAAPETLTFTVPPSATFAAHTLLAPQTITIEPMSGSGRFSGDLMTQGNDADIQAPSTLTLTLSLVGDL